jgi:Brp/Blh family beta-carotene 15,15'-monooxygenase
MVKINHFDIVKILITLICTGLGAGLPDGILSFLAAINVLTIGIIHGANDLYIASKIKRTVSKHQFSYLFGIYILFVFVMVFALYSFPLYSLLLFVIISSFHFGEQQWYQKTIVKSVKLYIFYVAFGFLFFALLFYTHKLHTANIIFEITQQQVPNFFFDRFTIFASILTTFLLIINFKQIKSQLFVQTIGLLSLLFLFSQTSLLWSFSVYFVLWHSLPSLKDQASVLYPYDSSPIRSYITSAIPYWLLSLIGFTVAVLFVDNETISMTSLFFAFLAAITIPHVIAIFLMHKKYIS